MSFNSWSEIIDAELEEDYFKQLKQFLINEYSNKIIYPKKENIFNSFELCEFKKTKVVILGQDPYHEPNQAFGLAFSVQKNCELPPSLVNIYKELASDLNIKTPTHGDLTSWAKQGVLLLNSIMTVEKGKALSHKDKGWEIFTDNVIKCLNEDSSPKVFILWGSYAQSKQALITNPNHLIIKSVHPSPLSAYRGFFGSRPFSKCNDFLLKNNLTPIDWEIK